MSAVTHFSQETQDANHHRLANLALVRARLKQWDLSEQDGRASIEIQPTILAHIAVSIALGGQGQLASAKQEFNQAFRCHGHENTCLLLLIKSIIIFVAGDRNEATRRVADLVKACEEADKPLCSAAQMQFLIGQTALYEQDYEKALSSFASVGALAPFLKLPGLGTISLIFGWDFDSLLLVIRQQTCEALYATSRMSEAVQSLQTLSNEFGAEMRASAELSNWLQSFTRRCVDALRTAGDAAMASGKHDEAIARYSAALSVSPTSQADLVVKRNKARLAIGAWDDATKDLDEAGASQFTVYTQIGEALLGAGRVNEATEMLRGLKGDLGNDGTMDGKQGDRFTAEDTSTPEERAAWEIEFRQRCVENLEKLGDTAMDSGKCDEAIGYYSNAVSLDPANLVVILMKRSKVLTTMGSWQDALTDANKAIELDPSSPWGYERKHAALHKAGDYANAINAFETMLSKISQSSDPEIRVFHHRYINPGVTRMAVRHAVQDAIRDSPRVLINTMSGRLHDKSEQVAAFESHPLFEELISSTTTDIDHARIVHDVTQYCPPQAALFSNSDGLTDLFSIPCLAGASSPKTTLCLVWGLVGASTVPPLALACHRHRPQLPARPRLARRARTLSRASRRARHACRSPSLATATARIAAPHRPTSCAPRPCPCPVLARTSSHSQKRCGDNDDVTIVTARSPRRRRDHSPACAPSTRPTCTNVITCPSFAPTRHPHHLHRSPDAHGPPPPSRPCTAHALSLALALPDAHGPCVLVLDSPLRLTCMAHTPHHREDGVPRPPRALVERECMLVAVRRNLAHLPALLHPRPRPPTRMARPHSPSPHPTYGTQGACARHHPPRLARRARCPRATRCAHVAWPSVHITYGQSDML
ncbi:hypothetical protein L210DRAFT_3641225 [Boletus edulis BED1]|uniref:Uncharacterized protein n=1 Tax=Boletus edulis BED1 TaxID=1328754 RepID=A0AAD4GIY9_BOLED|nr:hypothetical protein L210DRAFT_3641225 [Boletus edulis BED1]